MITPQLKGVKTTPYWWDDAPPARLERPALPKTADAVVVGSGYTGLHAALRIARAGRSVVVLEAGQLGHGCSTRNGGQISDSIKPDLQTLTRRYGANTAQAMQADGAASRRYVEAFVRDEGIACDFRVCGRFHAAAHPRAYAALERLADGEKVTLVPKEAQRAELGTDWYHGGVVFRDHAALNPGKYHAGLLATVQGTSALIAPETPAESLDEGPDGVTVRTSHGNIRARDVMLATNGYSGDLSPWHRRRVIPIGSYIIATEALDPDLVRRLFPTGRIVSDSRRVVYYYRTSPDGRRILFGGRVSAGETDLRTSAQRLRRAMDSIFPELASVRITHSWMGYVAYTFDTLAHIGHSGRIHHAMGYCGSGVGMASYLGMKAGLTIIGDADAATGLANRRFSTRPFYSGKPWFLPATVELYRALDRIGW